MNLWKIRNDVLDWSVFLLTYIFPIVKCIVDINYNKFDQFKNTLCYWIIISTSSWLFHIASVTTFALLLPGTTSVPRELKVIVLYWLSDSKMRGAEFIYSLFISPLFNHVEKSVDELIYSFTSRIQSLVGRQVQAIAWQLLLSPNDGLLSSAIQVVSKISSYDSAFLKEYFGITLFHHDTLEINLASDGNISVIQDKSLVRKSSRSLGRALLNEFSQLLSEGLCIEAGPSLQKIQPCRVEFSRCRRWLQISSCSDSENAENRLFSNTIEEKEEECENDSSYNSHFPLAGVVDISPHPSLSCMIIIRINTTIASEGGIPHQLYLQGEDEEETDTLLAGLQILATARRGTSIRALNKLDASWRRVKNRQTFQKLKQIK
jgi:hypothetical protein